MPTVRQFTIPTTAAVNDTIVVAHGGGGTPVAAILIAQWYQSATDGVQRPADAVAGVGFMTGATSRRSVSHVSQDSQVLAAQSIRDDAVLSLPYNDGNDYGRLDLQGWDATNATFIVDAVWFSQTRCIVMFLFSADVSEAAIVDFTEPAATGTQDVTGLTGGAATMALFIGCDSTAALNTVQVSSAVMVGMCAGPNGEGVWLGGIEDGVSNTQRAYCRAGECGAMYNRTTQAFDARFIFSSFITNGVRIDWQTRTTTGRRYCALLLRGGQHEVNSFSTSTTTGANVTVSGLPNQARGGIVFSANRAQSTASTLSNDLECSMGAFASLTERAVHSARSPNGAGVIQSGQESDEVLLRLTGAGAPSVDAAADIDVLGSSSIEFDQTDGDSAASFALVWTLHDAAAGPQTQTGSGSVTATGTLRNLVRRSSGGSVTATGALNNTVPGGLTQVGGGSVQPSGELDLTIFVDGLGGVVQPSGALTNRTSRASGGVCIPSGALRNLVRRASGGSVTPGGTLTQSGSSAATQSLSGSCQPSGSLSNYLLPPAPPAGALLLQQSGGRD